MGRRVSTRRRQLARAAAAGGAGRGNQGSGTAPWAEGTGSAGSEGASGVPPVEEREAPHTEEKGYDLSERSGGEEGSGEAEAKAGPANTWEGRAAALAADQAMAAALEADPEGQSAGEEQGADVVSQGTTPAYRCWLVGSTR